MIAADASLWPGEQHTASEPSAPMLPVETFIVKSALAAEQLRSRVIALLYFLEHTPRAAPVIERECRLAQDELNAVWASYSAYREVMTCEGQA